MAEKLTYQDLLDAGVHFGHLTRKWNPKMAEYIFMENNGIHLIDLNKTLACLDEASYALKNIVRSGRKIMFVATKKQAKDIVTEEAKRLNMPYVTERWLGGMLTNFATIRKSLKKLSQIEKLMKDESFQNLAKRERLMVTCEKAKLEKLLGRHGHRGTLGVAFGRLPARHPKRSGNTEGRHRGPLHGITNAPEIPQRPARRVLRACAGPSGSGVVCRPGLVDRRVCGENPRNIGPVGGGDCIWLCQRQGASGFPVHARQSEPARSDIGWRRTEDSRHDVCGRNIAIEHLQCVGLRPDGAQLLR